MTRGFQRFTFLPCLIALIYPLLVSTYAAGQEPRSTPMTAVSSLDSDLTLETIASNVEATQNNLELDDEVKKQILSQFAKAEQALRDLASAQNRTEELNKMALSVDQEESRIESELSSLTQSTFKIPSNSQLKELEDLFRDAVDSLSDLENEVKTLADELPERTRRAAELPAEIAEYRRLTEELQSQARATPPAGERRELTNARRIRIASEELLYAQRIEESEAEQAAYTATNGLVPKQENLAKKRVEEQRKYITELNRRLDALSAKETRAKVTQARVILNKARSELRPLAQENLQTTLEYQTQKQTVKELAAQLESLDRRLKKEADDYEERKERVDTLGLTNALGRLLREERIALTRERLSLTQKRRSNASVRDDQERVLSISTQRDDLLESEEIQKTTLLLQLETAYPNEKVDVLQDEVAELLDARLSGLGLLQTEYQATFEKRVALDYARLDYLKLIDRRLNYINERVLWIRSDPFLSGREIGNSVQDLGQFFSPERWEQLWSNFVQQRGYNLTFLILIFILVGTSGFFRIRAKRLLSGQGKVAIKRRCREFTPTVRSILLTLALSLIWPLAVLLLGWRIRMGEDTELFAFVLGNATLTIVLFVWPFEWARHVTRDGGLAECHFAVSAPVRRLLRFHAKWFVILGTGLLWMIETSVALEEGSLSAQNWTGAVGRIALLIFLLQLTVQVLLFFSPKRGIGALLGESAPKHFLFRFRIPLFVFTGVVFPVLIGLLCFGFGYTSIVLTKQVLYSAGVTIGVVSISLIIRRWLLIRRRRLALKQYLERVAKQKVRRDAENSSKDLRPFEMPEEETVNLTALNQQSLRLLYGIMTLIGGSILWLIWTDILPAFQQIGRMELWKVDHSGELMTVTLASVLLSAFVFALTFFASKNVPALLEMFLVAQLPFDSGARFAIKSITRYILIVTGVVVALSMIHVQWSQYQWLVAGASVGLGFGLQEIFANLVSGLIVLLERPCRVGDVVTVGDVTGVVSRIQIRATTVTNWDRQELIVPNREFVTGRLLNWTLSNAVNRLTIPVGIAYGSDTELATRLLNEVVRSNENILEDPAPLVTFQNFGASSLDFMIRCYLPSLENRLGTVHALHSEIDRVFREHNIEISFPQQDLHLRTVSSDVSQALANGFGLKVDVGSPKGAGPLDK